MKSNEVDEEINGDAAQERAALIRRRRMAMAATFRRSFRAWRGDYAFWRGKYKRDVAARILGDSNAPLQIFRLFPAADDSDYRRLSVPVLFRRVSGDNLHFLHPDIFIFA